MDNSGTQIPNQNPQMPGQPVNDTPWQSTPVQPAAPMSMPTPDSAPAWQATQTTELPTPAPLSQPIATTPMSEQPMTTSPWQSTPVQPVAVIATPEIATVEPPLVPKKAKMPPAILGVLSLFVVAGVAGGTYLLSMGVSSEKSVAPNAPSSQPKAFDPNEGTNIAISNPTEDIPFDQNGTADCSNIPFTAAYGNRCVATVTLESGEVTWAPGAIEALTQ